MRGFPAGNIAFDVAGWKGEQVKEQEPAGIAGTAVSPRLLQYMVRTEGR
jgi:hypothetical protein